MRRNVELVIEEPSPGQFFWALLGREVFGKPREVLDHARTALPSNGRATEAGVQALQRYLDQQGLLRNAAPHSPPPVEKSAARMN